MPREIGKIHRCLMLKFFDKAESSVINKIREMVCVDKDDYLVPIYLLAKLLPSLKHGLKMIGMIKKAEVMSF